MSIKKAPYTWEFTNLDKYANGAEISYTVDEDRINVITGTDTADTYAVSITNSKKTENDRVDDSVTVKKADQTGADLTGAVFTLYNGSTVIGTYNAPEFTISSSDGGPLPEQTEVLNDMVRFAFGPITFIAPDLGECHMTADGTSYTCEPKTYHYTVTESGSVSGVTNDSEKEFAVTVSVDEDRNVKAVCEPENLSDVLNFTNSYVPYRFLCRSAEIKRC